MKKDVGPGGTKRGDWGSGWWGQPAGDGMLEGMAVVDGKGVKIRDLGGQVLFRTK